MAPNTCRNGFLYGILCIITRTTRKLKVVQERFTYQTIALLSEISILLVRAVFEVRSMSYEFKHASQPLSNTTFCAYLTFVTQKLQVVHGCSTYQTAALPSEMPIFCVRAGCEIWMTTCASKYASHPFSGEPFICIQLYMYFRHITGKLQVICERSASWTTAILLDTFFVWFRVAWEIRLESYGLRHAAFIPSSVQHCVRILQSHTYIAISYATTPENKTHVPYDCIVHTKRQLYCQQSIVL